MNINNLCDIAITTFCLLAIWYLYFWLYKEYATDLFRQDVFELRDKLFDEASEGMIDFNHPAYCLLRRTMNGTIRYSHKTSFMLIFFISLLFRNSELKQQNLSFEKRFETATESVNEEVKKKLIDYRKDLQKITFVHLIRESPFTFFFIILLLICLSPPITLIILCCKRIVSMVKSFCHSELDSLESAALAAGRL